VDIMQLFKTAVVRKNK